LSYDMRVEPATAIIGIDIEGMLCQAGDRRAHEPAAEGNKLIEQLADFEDNFSLARTVIQSEG
jgi:hypothetical protein